MNEPLPSRILFVLFGAIGDVTRALPLAVRFKRAMPELEIGWAVEPNSYPLVASHPAVARVHLFERHKKFPAYLNFLRLLRKERYELVLDLQRHLKSGVTSRLSGARRRVGFHRRNAKELNWLFNNEHIPAAENFWPKVLHYQLFGDYFGLPRVEPLDFGFAVESEERIENLLRDAALQSGAPHVEAVKRVALIIGGTWVSKMWMVEHYRRLIEEMYRRWGFVGYLIGGKGEQQVAREITDGLKVPVVSLVERTALNDLPALFVRFRLAVGSDTGPMHLASAVRLPVIALFGSTSPRRSAPYGSEHLVLESAIPCSPCYRRSCPGLNRLCMESISPEAVLLRIEGVLKDSGPAGEGRVPTVLA